MAIGGLVMGEPNLNTAFNTKTSKIFKWNYKSGMQTSPLTFMAIFEAYGLILAPKHMFPLILLSLRILKWGEKFLKVNFGIIYGYFKGPGGNSMWLRPSQK